MLSEKYGFNLSPQTFYRYLHTLYAYICVYNHSFYFTHKYALILFIKKYSRNLIKNSVELHTRCKINKKKLKYIK